VKALRKPTVGAWALNQAVRRRRKETEALLAISDELRTAQEALLAGGDPSHLRKATREERALTSALADCAEAIASEAGKSGPALRDRVRATLHAAAVDEEARAELEARRFTREREAVGLGAFGGAPEASAGETATRAPARKPPARGRGRATAKPARPPKRTKGGGSSSAGASGSGAGGSGAGGSASGATREDPAAAARREQLAEAEAELSEARQAHETAAAEHATALGALESARVTLREAEVAERDARRVMREHEREVAKRERKVDRLRPKR
jgi:hypothetical protein